MTTGSLAAKRTPVAVAIGCRAIQNGFDALFVTAPEDLSVASHDNQLADSLHRYVSHVLADTHP